MLAALLIASTSMVRSDSNHADPGQVKRRWLMVVLVDDADGHVGGAFMSSFPFNAQSQLTASTRRHFMARGLAH